MSAPERERVARLEQAILQRAESLARDKLKQAAESAAKINADAAARLRLREEKEFRAAKVEAEKVYHRIVQAGEIKMQAELDHLRWDLSQALMLKLTDTFLEFIQSTENNFVFLRALLLQAAREIEHNELSAEVNARDYALLQERWQDIETALPAGKKMHLLQSEDPTCLGGVLVYSKDRCIRIDNTFQGRVGHLRNQLLRTVLGRLFAGACHMPSLSG